MSSRVLICLSLILSLFSIYIYIHRDKVPNKGLTIEKRIDYKASGIRSIQTNEEGKVDLSMDADELLHNLETDTLTLHKTNAQQTIQKKTSSNKNDAHVLNFQAQKIIWNRPQNTLMLLNGITLSRTQLPINDIQTANQTKNSQVIKTESLVYNLSSHVLKGNTQIEFKDQKATFLAQGLHANLATGIYDFNRIKAQYTP